MSTKIKAIGSRAEVFHSRARHTSGGLKKSDLMQTKNGRIVSRKAHAAGKKAIKRLRALGYVAKKGTFRLFRKGDATSRRSSSRRRRSTRRRRGGFFEGDVPAAASTAASAIKDMMGAVTGNTAGAKY
jgi:hypothetical protein